jgi:SAM-dependent methyltransferase
MESNKLKAHYDAVFAEQDGELYAPLSGLNLAAHKRRMELLDSIELPNLSQATVVDYGVGSWGFGCIYPKLKQCRTAIGFDISQYALGKSAEVSALDPIMAHKNVSYLVSLGYELSLPDAYVDVFFCGECIEHVEDTKAFLTEIHRVLKPSGVAIFTTPNRAPWIYRHLGVQWCVGFEHVALMDFVELRNALEQFFQPVRYMGFNQSIVPGAEECLSPELQEQWVRGCLDEPADATSLIAVVSKASEADARPRQRIVVQDWTDIPSSEAVPLNLSGESFGGMLQEGGFFKLQIPKGMDRCNLIFWGHDWSGHVEIEEGKKRKRINLYSLFGGCVRCTVENFSGSEILITATGERDARSSSSQVILYRAVFGGNAI